MLHTVIQKNNYQDSIVLMLLTNQLLTLQGIKNASVMMGTPANKDIFKTSGLYTDDMAAATSNDMVLVLDMQDQSVIETVMVEIERFLNDQSKTDADEGPESVKTWDKALSMGADADVVVLSVPGTMAANEIETALAADKHVFVLATMCRWQMKQG